MSWSLCCKNGSLDLEHRILQTKHKFCCRNDFSPLCLAFVETGSDLQITGVVDTFILQKFRPTLLQMYTNSYVTSLIKLGKLGSELFYSCVLKSKTEDQVKNESKTCYFHKGFTKKVQIMSKKSCKQHHQMISCKFQVSKNILLNSNLSVKPFYMTGDFVTFRSCY